MKILTNTLSLFILVTFILSSLSIAYNPVDNLLNIDEEELPIGDIPELPIDSIFNPNFTLPENFADNEITFNSSITGLDVSIDETEVVNTEWTTGESVNTTYDFASHYVLPESIEIVSYFEGDTVLDVVGRGIQASYCDDSIYWQTGVEDTNDDDECGVYTTCQIEARTSGILYYQIEYLNDSSVFENRTGTYSVSDSLIDATGRITVVMSSLAETTSNKFWYYLAVKTTTVFSSSDTYDTQVNMWLKVDYLYFVQDDIVSQIRSECRQTDSPDIREHRLEIENWEYQTSIDIELPLSWDTDNIEVNPSCSYSLSGNTLTLSDTVPTTYTVHTTSNSSELRLLPATKVNSQVMNSTGFESGSDDWNETGSSFSTHALTSSIVFGGDLAYNITDSDASNDTLEYSYAFSNGTYFINFEHYLKSFSGTDFLFMYYNNSWIEESLDTTVGYWQQNFLKCPIAGNDSGINLKFRFHNASGTFYLDDFDIFMINLEPKTTGFDQTRFRCQWRYFDGYNNPVATAIHVNMKLEEYPAGTLVKEWDYSRTNDHGIASFYWHSRLYEQSYNLTSAYWDTTTASSFNNGSIQFTPVTTSHGGAYSWEFYGDDEGWEVTASSIEYQIDGIRNFTDRSYDSFEGEETIWIQDPTNQSNQILFNTTEGEFQELYEARQQQSYHSYNISRNTYTYKSGYNVIKPDVNLKTDWVSYNEYPVRYIVRNKAGISLSVTLDELISLFSTYDNSTLWSLGIEGFGGIMGFYMNFEDVTWGYGQYLYYPRFINGCLAPYNFPQFQIFPHAYFKLGSTWYDHIFTPTNSSRNRIYVENTTDVLKVYYEFQSTYLSRTFQFRYGIKYNTTEHLFHMINHFVCLDQDFDDVGFAYEVDNTQFARGTEYQVKEFCIVNDTYSLTVNIQEAWEAGTYLNNFMSQVEFVSENNERFTLYFEDMLDVGFTQKYLNLHNQLLPNGNSRLVLRVGMYGYGSYTQGTVIEIDPTFSERAATDADDFYCYETWQSAGPSNPTWASYFSGSLGLTGFHTGSYGTIYQTYFSFDTGITSTIGVTSNAEFGYQVYDDAAEGNEYGSVGLYYHPTEDSGYINESTTLTSENQFKAADDYGYYEDPDGMAFVGAAWHTADDTIAGNWIDAWATNHNENLDRTRINFYAANGTGMDWDTDEQCRWRESSYATEAQRYNITFDYTANTAPNAPTLNTDSGNTYAGKTHTIITDHTDDDGDTDIDTMWLFYDTSSEDIVIYCPQATASGSVTISSGSAELIGTPTYSHTTDPTNGYRVTWTITLDWDWDEQDDTTYTVKAKTIDDSAADSGYATLDSNNEFENDLIVKSISYAAAAFPDGLEEGKGSTIDDDEWIKGSTSVTCSGVICYQGALTTYPDTDEVDVELMSNDNTLLGEDYDDDTLGSSGEFSIAAYTAGASTDTDYDFNVSLVDWLGSGGAANYDYSGSETQCSNGVDIDSKIDATAPLITVFSCQHSDSDSDADGYDPQEGYDDDTTLEYTASGVGFPSDGDSGLATDLYRYQWKEGSWTAWTSSNTYSATASGDGDTGDVDVQVRDKVGNSVEKDGEDVTVELTDPSGYDMDLFGTAEWGEGEAANYVWIADPTDITSGTLVYNSGAADIFYTSCDGSGSDGGSGIWAVVFEAGFGESELEDTSSPYNSSSYQVNSASETSLWIKIVNNGGHVETITITTTDDTSAPTMASITVTGDSAESGYSDWDNNGIGFQIDFATTTDVGAAGMGTIKWIIEVNDATPDEYITGTDPYTYPVDVGSDGVHTFYAQAIDRVGNFGTLRSDIGYVDQTAPSLTTGLFSDEGYLSGTVAWYDQGADETASFEITFTESNVSRIVVVCTLDASDRASDGGNDESSPFTSSITISGRSDVGSTVVSVTIYDKAGNSDTTFSSTLNTIALDDTGPGSYSIVMESGVFYADKTNDMTPLLTISGASDGSGVGLHTTPYNLGWEVNEGGFTDVGYQAGATWSPSLSTDSSNYDFRGIVKDKLGNIGSYVYDNDNMIEDDIPTSLSIYQIIEDTLPQYLYVSGSTIVYSNAGSGNRQFTVYVECSDAFSGLEKATFPATVSSGGDDTTEEGGAYEYLFQYTADGIAESYSDTASVTVYDQCGNSNTVTFTVTLDDSNPNQVTTCEARPDGYVESSEFDNDVIIYFTWDTISDVGAAGVYTYFAEIGDSSPDEDAGTDQQDTDDGFEGLITYYIWAMDQVGNNGTVASDTITIDLTNPSVDGAVFSDDGYAPNWYDQGTDSYATIAVTWTETNVDTVWITVTGIDTYYDNSPSGGSTSFNVAINGESDGSYNIAFYMNDSSGRTDSETSGSFGDAPLLLDDSAPSFSSFSLDPDSDSDADGFNPQTSWYDSSTIQGDYSGASDGSGSGIANYYFKITSGGSYGSGDADGLNVQATAGSEGTTLSIYYKIVDNLGNEATGDTTIDVNYDDTNPSITDAFSAYGESGDTDEVNGEIGTNIFYFSNSFDTTAIVTFTATASDTYGVYGIDFGSFGGDDPTIDTSVDYQGQYTIDDSDSVGSITVKAVDNAGNVGSDTITMTEDATNPSISVTGETESSMYLWSGYGTSIQGKYGSGMGLVQTFTISGTASDASSGLLSLVDDTSFGDNPSNGGSLASWSFAYTIDASDNGDVTVTYTVTDNVGNSNTATYDFVEDNTNPGQVSVLECRPDSYSDTGEYDNDVTIYFTWTNVGDSDVYTYFAEIGDSSPDEDAGTDQQDTDTGSVGLMTYYILAMDQCGNNGTVASDTIFCDPITTTGSEYYTILVSNGSITNVSKSLTGVDWRIYTNLFVKSNWNGSSAFEVRILWNDVELISWTEYNIRDEWITLDFDLSGSHGSENDRLRDGTLKLQFRNTNGAINDIQRVKRVDLNYLTYDSSDSDWSWVEPDDMDGWSNATGGNYDVTSSIVQMNSTGSNDLIMYRNETVTASDYDIFSIYARSSSNQTLYFMNGSNSIIGSFDCTTVWTHYLVTLNANWTGTQTDILIVWQSASSGDWYEINWLLMEENFQTHVLLDQDYMRFYSANNTLKLRVRIDGKLIGDYWDLEDIPLDTSEGIHTVEYTAWFDSQTPTNGYQVYIHARTYYFTYEYGSFKVNVESYSHSDDYVNLYVTGTRDGNYTIFENNTQEGTGSFSKTGTIITHTRNTTAGAYITLAYKFMNGSNTVWFNTTYSNAVTDTFYISEYRITINNTYVSVNWTLSLNGGTCTAWEDGTLKASDDSTAPTEWSKSATEGTHFVTLLFEKTGYDDLIREFNYEVSITDFSVSIESLAVQDVVISLYLTSSKDGSYYVFENDSSSATGSFDGNGTFLQHNRDTTAGSHIQLCYYFNDSDGNGIWFNTTYDNAATTYTFYLSEYYISINDTYVRVYWTGSIAGSTCTVYEDGSLKVSSDSSSPAEWVKSTTGGEHFVTLLFEKTSYDDIVYPFSYEIETFEITAENFIIGDYVAQYSVTTTKDDDSTTPTITLYLNGTEIEFPDGTTNTTPGIIIFSRPDYGYYNFCRLVEWGSESIVDSWWITVTSNAEVTHFVVSIASNYFTVDWGTNKGTAILTIYDNSSAIQTDNTEGLTYQTRDTTEGVHNLAFNISVEGRTFSYYANYTVSPWTVTVYLTADQRVAIEDQVTLYATTVRSDGGDFYGTVVVNGTSITITNDAGSTTVTEANYGNYSYVVQSVVDNTARARSHTDYNTWIRYDKLNAKLKALSSQDVDPGDDFTFNLNLTYIVDDTIVTNTYTFDLYINDRYYQSYTSKHQISATLTTSGTHALTLKNVRDLDYYITEYKSDTLIVVVTGKVAPKTEWYEDPVTALPAIVVLIAVGIYVIRKITSGDNSNHIMKDQNTLIPSSNDRGLLADASHSRGRTSGRKKRKFGLF